MAIFSAKAWFRQQIKPYLTIIKANISGGGGGVKGTVTITFANVNEGVAVIAFPSISSNSVVVAKVDIVDDEIFSEEFLPPIVKKQNGVGFTIFVEPKIGNHTGPVIINYIIF